MALRQPTREGLTVSISYMDEDGEVAEHDVTGKDHWYGSGWECGNHQLGEDENGYERGAKDCVPADPDEVRARIASNKRGKFGAVA